MKRLIETISYKIINSENISLAELKSAIDDLIEKNLRYILSNLNISKQDLAIKLEAEEIVIKSFLLNPLFSGDVSRKTKPEIVQIIIKSLGLPLPILTMADANTCLDGLVAFFIYGKELGKSSELDAKEIFYQKRIKSLENGKERASEKHKVRISELKKETKAVILELSKKVPQIKESDLPDNHVFVDGVIPKTREAQFYSWCIDDAKKRTKKS